MTDNLKDAFPQFPNRSLAKVEGLPLSDDLKRMFSPWGVLKGVAVSDQHGIEAQFEGGYHLTFVPVHSGGIVKG